MPTTRLGVVELQAASMSSFSMNGSPTCTLGPRCSASASSKVALASTDTPPMPSRPVLAPISTTTLPGPAAALFCRRSLGQHADAERVDQRVALVAGVEDDLAADVGQAEAVAVAADAGDDAGQHPRGVRVVGRAEAQRVHHRDRAGAHGEDVPDDAADPGGRALVGLDEGRMVVRLDLERDRAAVADVDDAGVLADAGEHAGRVGGAFSPNWRRCTLLDLYEQCSLHMIEYMASSDSVGRRPRIVADPRVLVVAQAELGVRLLGSSGVGLRRCSTVSTSRRRSCQRRS